MALIGNPNTGKSTLFNCLTGLRQKVGNYSGVTVQKKTGITSIGSQNIEILDLPGTYSLAAESPDERVVVEVLRGEIENVDRPDMAVYFGRHQFEAKPILGVSNWAIGFADCAGP